MSVALRAEAEGLAGPLPALLAEARHLAAGVVLGEHGRRRAGVGADFWQYRALQPGEDARGVDWRRSARGDVAFAQDKEWQTAQAVTFWVDRGRSMGFASKGLPAKAARARVLALALAVLLMRGGERVGMAADGLPPRRGEAALMRVAARMAADAPADYAEASAAHVPAFSRAVVVSDFLGDPAPVERAVAAMADRGVGGVMLQVLDPAEEAFPYEGRTVFESMGGTLRHETLRAGDLRGEYLARLAERRDRLATLARRTGWRWGTHRTDQGAAPGLLWLAGAVGALR